MSKHVSKITRMIVLCLCVALLLTNALIIAPVVGAASDTTKTETEMNDTIDIPRADDDILTQRAIAIDEAKKEAEAAVNEQLAIIAEEEAQAEAEKQEAEKAAAEEAETEAAEAEKADETIEAEEVTEATEAEVTEPETTSEESAESSSTSDEEETIQTTIVSSGAGFLMDIDNPDPEYTGTVITLSDSDRELTERMLMGEAGSMGYNGMALVAQCIRDTYVSGGYGSIADVLAQNGYYGSTSIVPSETAKDVVSYIFDQGGSAVQHSVRVFYASNYCTSDWHEAQEFVCAVGYVRFFDI